MSRPRPRVVPLDSVPAIPADEAPTKVRIARLVTREGCGSNLPAEMLAATRKEAEMLNGLAKAAGIEPE